MELTHESPTKLTLCQQKAFNYLEQNQNIFITGGAGTGKTFLVKNFLINQKGFFNTPILASTGVAALLLGGRTFHSFFSLGILEGGVEKVVGKALRDKKVVKRIKEAHQIVIDEVSMLSEDAFTAAEAIARGARESEEAWGGLRLILVGDFAQLPPVSKFNQKKSWIFLSEVWRRSNIQVFSLKTQVRCKDDFYMGILNKVRMGIVDEEVDTYMQAKEAEEITASKTFLFPRKVQTESFNLSELEKIEAPLFVFDTEYSGKKWIVDRLKKISPLEQSLHLKIGALVMLKQNDPMGRWINGSTGIVAKINDEKITVDLLEGRRVNIKKASFKLLDGDGELLGEVENFPLALAYATTIHKAQGQTLNSLYVNLRDLWESGQAYVALSRVKQGQDLSIQGWSPNVVKCDPLVIQFYEKADSA